MSTCARAFEELLRKRLEAEGKKVKTCDRCGKLFTCNENFDTACKGRTHICICDDCSSQKCGTKYVTLDSEATRVTEKPKLKPKISIEEIERLEKELLR